MRSKSKHKGLYPEQKFRLKLIIEICFKNSKKLALASNSNVATLARVLRGEEVTVGYLLGLENAGINIGWVFNGLGLPFVFNKKGMKLFKKYYPEFKNKSYDKDTIRFNDDVLDVIKKIIQNIIEKHYGSIDEYSKDSHFRLSEIQDIFSESSDKTSLLALIDEINHNNISINDELYNVEELYDLLFETKNE